MRVVLFVAAVGIAAGGCSAAGKLGVPGASGSGDKRGGGDAEFDAMVEIPPADGVATVDPMAPTWCDQIEASGTGGALKRRMTEVQEAGWNPDSVPLIASYLCLAPDDPDFQQQTAYYVQSVVNVTGFEPSRAIESITARLDEDTWKAELEQACKQHRVGEEAHPATQKVAKAYMTSLGCGYQNTPAWMGAASDPIGWHLDANPQDPSEILVAYHVHQCRLPNPGEELEPHHRMRFAACGWDAVGLDEDRLEAEIQEWGYEGYAKVVIREHHARARLIAAHAFEQAQKIAEEDESWGQVMLAGPNTAFTGWNNLYKQNKSAFDAALAVDRKLASQSRRAIRGCADEMRGHFFDYVKGKQPDDVPSAAGAATDIFGLQLLLRLRVCEAAEGNTLASQVLETLATRDVQAISGPRAAAYFYTLGDIVEIRKDRPRFPIEETQVVNASTGGINLNDEASQLERLHETKLHHQDEGGVVKSVKRQGDEVIVSFRRDTYQEPTYDCRDTNRISRIENGRVHYERDCRVSGSRTVDQTPPDVRIAREYAAGIRRGAMMNFRRELTQQGTPRAIPLAVWRSKADKKLVAYYGAPL